jgi:hypothetical protein
LQPNRRVAHPARLQPVAQTLRAAGLENIQRPIGLSSPNPYQHPQARQLEKVRIPTKPAGYSDLKAATHSDLKAATIPI